MSLDKVSPGVEVKIGGKVRKLVFNMWAFYLLERETGKNVLQGELFSSPTSSDILTLLWAGLQSTEKVSIEDLGKMVELSDLPDISKAITEAFQQAAVPEGEKKTNTQEVSELR
jgi:hypothetical protein